MKKPIKYPCKFSCGNPRHSGKCERCKKCCEGEPKAQLRDHFNTLSKAQKELIQRQTSLV